jgi:hypothetical protein
MGVTRIPDPEGTAWNCRQGCGLMTVLAEDGSGRSMRVHCGTWRTECPHETRVLAGGLPGRGKSVAPLTV